MCSSKYDFKPDLPTLIKKASIERRRAHNLQEELGATQAMNDQVLQRLQVATENLLFPSESDYPIVPFTLPDDARTLVSPADFLSAEKYAPDTPIQKLDFNDFFARKSQIRDGQDEGQQKTARRLGELADTLHSTLSDLHVYKVGSLHFDLFVLSRTSDGRWMRVSTESVKT